VVEREVGWLVRTKGMESNEVTGFLVLDSVLLVQHYGVPDEYSVPKRREISHSTF
jgi:hypothetical protein